MNDMFQTECEEWIKTANVLIQEAGGESDLPADVSPQVKCFALYMYLAPTFNS